MNVRVEPHDTVEIDLLVNGTAHRVAVESRSLLSDVLRHRLGLTGTHVSCEQGGCGACLILLDGEPVTSCTTLAITLDGSAVTTIEGLAESSRHDALRHAFRSRGALQCGFCTPGMFLACAALLDGERPRDRREIRERLTGQQCRCTGYAAVIDAVSDVLADGGAP